MICNSWLIVVWVAVAFVEVGKMRGGLGLGIKPSSISFQTFEFEIPRKYTGGDVGGSFGIH